MKYTRIIASNEKWVSTNYRHAVKEINTLPIAVEILEWKL